MKNNVNVNKVFFKPVVESDFDILLKLENESFNLYDRLDRETLNELYTEFKDGFYLIISDDIIAGSLIFLIEDGIGYIESIAISKSFRHMGLGIAALRYMKKSIRKTGIEKVELHVRFDNHAAMALYEKEGFVKKGIVEGFYKDGEPAYLYGL